jgi:anti-anti-sigma regulatory factor
MTDFSLTTTTPKEAATVREIGISGAMTIHHAGEIRTALLEALDEADEVRMEMARVTEIDLVGLQLLCSAHQSSVAINKRFSLGGCCDIYVKEIIDGSGFRRHIGCVQDVNQTCLWLGGGK